MENNTKQVILDTALELFSKKGFEGTSVGEIAEAVGIKKASLYAHFKSKQEILETSFNQAFKKYDSDSIFHRSINDTGEFQINTTDFDPEEVVIMVKNHIHYTLNDYRMSRGRKLLTIEQYRDPKMAKLKTRQAHDEIMRFYKAFMEFLIDQSILINENVEIMAAQFCLPISMWLEVCDREPDREEDVMRLIGLHIHQFFRIYGKSQK